MKIKSLCAVFCVCFGIHNTTWADVTLTNPSPAIVKACDDYATKIINNPWDMSSTEDINNFFPGNDITHLTSASFSSGIFSATTTTGDSSFYLTSPVVVGSHAWGGRFGYNFPFDTSLYKQLSIRMYSESIDTIGMRFIWNTGRNYVTERTVTSLEQIVVKPGWNTYSVDLNSLTLESGGIPWSSATVTGFSVRPTTVTGNPIQIDWIRLESPTSCSSGASSSFSYTPTTSGNNDLTSVYLDTDSNPYNGYIKKLVSSQAADNAAHAVNISSPLGIGTGTFKPYAVLDSDYATLETDDPWNMSDVSDLKTYGGFSGAGFASGIFSGTIANDNAQIYLRLGADGINADKYKKLSIKVERTDPTQQMVLYYTIGSTTSNVPFINRANNDPDANNVYEVNLSGYASWTGTVTELILVAYGQNTSFALDYITLRKTGFAAPVNTSSPTSFTSSGSYRINQGPVINIEEPNIKGGIALHAWNMNNGDFKVFANLDSGPDSNHAGENLTTYLPDVRLVDGLRGDFFKGSNVPPSDDPVQYSIFPNGTPGNDPFNGYEYKNLCFKIFTDRDFILDNDNGSMARVLWKKPGGTDYESGGAIILFPDGWTSTKWYEYCGDLTQLESDALLGTSRWSDEISELRVDPNEIRLPATYYFDYIKLRKNDTAFAGKYRILYSLADGDTASPTVSLYYNTTRSTSGATLIASGLPSTERSYLWDTSAVPNGTYYILAVATDGINQTPAYATGQLAIDNPGRPDVAPEFVLDAPAEATTWCDSIQLKGYALQADRLEDVSSIEVLIDGTIVSVIHPSVYSPAAKAAFPNVDSSNTGFNQLLDISGLTNAGHVLTLKAHSSNGATTTKTVNFTKSGSGCSSIVSDADPSGSPVVVSDLPTAVPTASLTPTFTPTPSVSNNVTVSKAKHTASGLVQITVAGIAADNLGCKLALRGRALASDAPKNLVSSKLVAKDITKKCVVYQLGSLKVGKKGPSNIFISASLTCSGSILAESPQKSMKLKRGSSGNATAAKVLTALKKLKKK